jgi:hypothetical protein
MSNRLGFVRRNGEMVFCPATLKWKKSCPLRKWRISSGLSLSEAASLIGIAANTYSFYEHGWRFPQTPFVRVWNPKQTNWSRRAWDDLIYMHTNVKYEDMVAWYKKRPKEKTQ